MNNTLPFKRVPIGGTIYLKADQIPKHPAALARDLPPMPYGNELEVWSCTKVSENSVCLWGSSVSAPLLFVLSPECAVIAEGLRRRIALDVHGVHETPGNIEATPSYLSDVLSTAAALMERLVGEPDWKDVLHQINDDLGNRNGHMTLYDLVDRSARALQKAYTEYLHAHSGADTDHPSPYLYDVPDMYGKYLLLFMRGNSAIPEDDWVRSTAKKVIHRYFNPPTTWRVTFAGGSTPFVVKAYTLQELEESLKADPVFGPNAKGIITVSRIAN